MGGEFGYCRGMNWTIFAAAMGFGGFSAAMYEWKQMKAKRALLSPAERNAGFVTDRKIWWTERLVFAFLGISSLTVPVAIVVLGLTGQLS